MKIKNLPSSDVLVPVLFLVPEVLVLGRPLGRQGRGPSRPADSWVRLHLDNPCRFKCQKMTCRAGDSDLNTCTEVYRVELRFSGSVWFVSGLGCVWKDKAVI